MKTATDFDQVIGRRIAEVRTRRGMSQAQFAREVRAKVGVGWSRQAVWQVENGKSAMSATDLLAVALVLGCTVADLMSTTEPVSLGGAEVARTDAIVAGVDAMPEVEAWDRYEEAGRALADVRHAWERYAHLIDVVRRRVADSPALERRIRRDLDAKVKHAERQMADAFGFRSNPDDPEFTPESAARANPSPAMLTAVDALGTHKVNESQWRRWTRRQERSTR